MKLNSAQIESAVRQIEAEAIPPDHPIVPQLTSLFGVHTYFLDSHGLNIVEPAQAGDGAERAVVVSLADWATEKGEPKLRVHEPKSTDILIDLAA